MPLRTIEGRSQVILPFDVEVPKEVPIVPGKEGERTLTLERVLVLIATPCPSNSARM